MEKAHQPQTKTADNRLSQIITILLLLGGVFVLWLIWTIRYYHIYTDRVTPFVPESADFVMTIPLNEGSISLWSAFDGSFKRALSSIQYEKGRVVVLFVDKDVDKLTWQIMTDAVIDESIVPDTYHFSKYRHLNLISSSAPLINEDYVRRMPPLKAVQYGAGFGYVEENLLSKTEESVSRLPLRLKLSDSHLKLELGHRFRGLKGKREFPVHARKITVLPDTISSYTIIPEGGSPQLPLGYELESFLSTIIKNSGMTSEIVLTDQGDFASLLYSPNENQVRIEVIEQPIIDFLSTLTPKEEDKWLSDGTKMTELRLNKGKVSRDERMIVGDVLVRTYVSEDEREVSLILYPDGRIWVTNSFTLVTALLTSSIERESVNHGCQPSGSSPGIVFTKDHNEDISFIGDVAQGVFSSFKVNSIRIEDTETELYTICGYF